jgi:signal transduction histidine kinase
VDVKSGKIEFANANAKAGHIPKKFRCKTLQREIDKPCIGKNCNCTINRLIKSKKPYKSENLHIPVYGKRTYFELFGYPILNNKGEVEKIIEYNRNITPRKQAELKLKKSEKKLKNAVLLKDKYFSILAHDVRNPFNFLIGISELLQVGLDDIPKDELKSILEKIHITSKQTNTIFENLLFWARAQTGEISFNPVKLNVKDTLQENIRNLSLFAEAKNLNMTIEAMEEIYAHADENMVETILRNLSMNAIKFTKNDGSISFYAEQKNGKVQISVKDTGIGMSEEEINQLFRPEEKISQSGTNNEKGFGLGLLVSKEFVEKNKGSITVRSKKGEGSTFSFTLPAA